MLWLTLLPTTLPGLTSLAALIVTICTLLYLYATRHFNYWLQKGVPYVKPYPFVGNFLDVILFRKHFGQALHELHQTMSGPYCGIFIFDTPVLLVKDQSLLTNILHKDFAHFTDRGFTATKYDPMNLYALFCRKGKQWKDLRVKLGPAFTSGKLKKLFALIEQHAQNLDTYFDEAAKIGTPQNITDACGRFTTDVVASIGFGIESSSLRDGESEFRKRLKNAFVFKKIGVLRSIGMLARVPAAYHWGSKRVPDKLLAFLRRAIWDIVRHRQQTGTVGVRGDFLDLLIELRERGSIAEDDETSRDEKKEKTKETFQLEGDEFVSQAFTFLTAGFETSSTTMSLVLYRLALNQDIQTGLRNRLLRAIKDNNGNLSYEALQSVKYLDMIIMETLRLHPVLPFLDRTCTKAYRIPNSQIVIDEGTVVMVSQDGVHRDSSFYPDPDRFDPERFSDTIKAARPSCSYLAFGDGPRQCIGMRLGILQAKIGLAHILLNYKVHSDAPLTVEHDMESILYHPKNGIKLLLKRL